MSLIPDHIIEQIRTQGNIVDVIGEVVQLKKAGRNHLGLCPFHKEKTPSFTVSAERGSYKCFGCGRGGNIISFIQEHHNMSFPDAVRHLAAKMGIPIPEEEVEDPSGLRSRRDAARKCLQEVTEFYQKHLDTSDGAPARTFFETRGFNSETIQKFSLGAAPASWDATYQYLLDRGYNQQHLEDAGLIVIKDDGSMYDRFRGRAMFVICDESGRPVGFSARSISSTDDSAKYINSPQSLVFDKSRVLYGLHLAKREISRTKTAYFVEGQADVIAMHQAGFTQTVASSGTALTADQLRLVKRYASTVVFVFDADVAGQKATSKGIELALSVGLDVQCVALPEGEDPDSVIVSQGAEAMEQMLANAKGWIEYQTTLYRKNGDLDDPVRHAQAVRTLLTWIAGVPDKLRHPFLVRSIADRFSLDEQTLLAELSRINPLPPGVTISQPIERQEIPQRLEPPTKQPETQSILASERELLRIMLSVEHGLALMLNHFFITEDVFVSEQARMLFRQLVIAEEEHHDGVVGFLNSESVTEENKQLARAIMLTTSTPSAKWKSFDVTVPDLETERAVRDALLGLALFRVQEEIGHLTTTMQTAASADETKRVVYRLQQLINRRERLKREYFNSPSNLEWRSEDTVS